MAEIAETCSCGATCKVNAAEDLLPIDSARGRMDHRRGFPPAPEPASNQPQSESNFEGGIGTHHDAGPATTALGFTAPALEDE